MQSEVDPKLKHWEYTKSKKSRESNNIVSFKRVKKKRATVSRPLEYELGNIEVVSTEDKTHESEGSTVQPRREP